MINCFLSYRRTLTLLRVQCTFSTHFLGNYNELTLFSGEKMYHALTHRSKFEIVIMKLPELSKADILPKTYLRKTFFLLFT